MTDILTRAANSVVGCGECDCPSMSRKAILAIDTGDLRQRITELTNEFLAPDYVPEAAERFVDQIIAQITSRS